LGSHGRRFSNRLTGNAVLLYTARAAVLSLLIWATACSDGEKPDDILPAQQLPAGHIAGADIQGDKSASTGEITGDSSGEKPPAEKPPSIVFVRKVSPFLKNDFLFDVVKNRTIAVNRALPAVMTLFSFPGPAHLTDPPQFNRQVVRKIRDLFVQSLQEAPNKNRFIFQNDMEIFLVFNAAFEKMSDREKEDLFARWRDAIGEHEPPPPPNTRRYPLFWLRENAKLWGIGGQAWWWAYHALKNDPAFSFSRKKGARFVLADGTVYCSRGL